MSVSCHIAHSHQLETINTTLGGTLTVDASGTTVPVSGTFWQATQPVSGTVTANLGATDNAVLDSINTAVNSTLDVDVQGAITEGPSESYGSDDYSAGWANNTSTTALDMLGYRSFSFAQSLPSSSLGSETLVLEGSTDNVTFYHISDEYPSIATDSTSTSAYAWNITYSDLPFRYVRMTNRTGASIACTGPAMYHRSN